MTLWNDALAPRTLPQGAHVVQLHARGRREGAVVVARPASIDVVVEAIRAAREGHTSAPVQVSKPPPAPRRGLRVLVADDNAINLRVARGMLERLGCEVTTVEDGARVVAAFIGSRWDLVFVDCQMPELDGYEATAQMRAVEQGGRTPIIAMTANASREDRHRCLSAGMDDFLTKPCRIDDLARTVERWSPRSKVA